MKSVANRKVARRKLDNRRKPSKPPAPIEPTREYLTKRAICAKLDITLRTLETWIHNGNFPAPCRFTGQTLRWDAVEVKEFIEDSKSRVPV